MGLQSVALDQMDLIAIRRVTRVTQLSQNASHSASHNQIAMRLNMELLGSGATLQANVYATLQQIVGIRKRTPDMTSI
jgi:hypothetical protein